MDRRDYYSEFGSCLPKGTVDKRRMVYVLDEIYFSGDDEDHPPDQEVRFVYEVCGTCEGKGTCVNPSIDAHGITMEERDRDWSHDEWESYMNGGYDITCPECKGERVVIELSPPENSPMAKWLEAWSSNEVDYRREREYEMKYGY